MELEPFERTLAASETRKDVNDKLIIISCNKYLCAVVPSINPV